MEPFDGYQLADQIKKAHPDIGVVFMSGYFPDTNIPPHPDGAALVRKPFDDVSLLQKIAEVAK
jgi:CheY-like chemotaxis protein